MVKNEVAIYVALLITVVFKFYYDIWASFLKVLCAQKDKTYD